jgi:deoxyribodipyrimidine photolyase-related protein
VKSALLLYPHQLYPADQLPDVDTIFIVEDKLYFGVDETYPLRLHKQKLILHRASMRRYVEEVLWPTKVNVEYIELDPLLSTEDILSRASSFEQLFVFDPVDDMLTKRLLRARRETAPNTNVEFLDSPNFYLKDHEIREYVQAKDEHLFADFYQWQRERFNVLINKNYKPVGGKWSFDHENRERLPEGHKLPSFEVFGDNQQVRDAIDWVVEHFPDNPGGTDFIWPTNHQEAAAWLADFVEHRLDNFGPYEDAISGEAPWVYHSVLSPSMNIGLLSPQQVITAALDRHEKRAVPLASLEGFIRQVLGWREYMRGQYVVYGGRMRTQNVFNHNRQLTASWYDGTLGIPPFDDVVKKLQTHAYAHHIERLMVAGNLMLLCEIHPNEVYKWFSELSIDGFDWVMVPNVYGMSQFADGGSVITKPYVSSSNYLLKMSHYEKGDWTDIWDGLYWRFIEKHKSRFADNPRMRMIVSQLDKLDADRKRIITYRAEDFLKQHTK